MIPIFLAFLAAVFYGISKVFVKKAGNIDSIVGVFFTLSVALPMLILYAIISGEAFSLPQLNPWMIVSILLYSLSFLVVGRVFAYASINLVGAARASQLTSTQVIFAAILSVLFLQEDFTVILGAGTVAIFLGVLLISLSNPQNTERESLTTTKFRRGLILGLSSGLLWGISQPLAREIVRGLGSSIMASVFTYSSAVLVQSVLVICFARKRLKLTTTQAKFLLPSGIVFTTGVVAQYMALSSSPVVLINPIVNISPLITLLATYLFLQKIELVNRKVVFGALTVVFGALLVTIGL